MGKYLNIGNDGFEMIRNGTYVDKTGMISFLNSTLNTKRKLSCMSRPHRFGKSFAAQMLCAYYDRSCDSAHLFDDLKIAQDPFYGTHLNKYDVIYLDMTLFTSEILDVKKILGELQTGVIRELLESCPEAEREKTLAGQMFAVSEKTGRRFIVIIDEWDALFREAKDDVEVQDGYIKLLRSLFKSPLTDRMIAGAYMTGILPIKKYGTQSAMTDFREYSMVSPKQLAEYVGFTEEEVKQLCSEYGIDFETAKKWYDGYSFRHLKSVYNPNSVMEAASCGEFDSYWTQTETYEALKFYIDLDYDGLKESLVQMLGGAEVPVRISGYQNDMTSIQCRDDVLTLLIHLGYLAYDAEEKKVRIPNQEIREEFIYAVQEGKHGEIARLVDYGSDILLVGISYDEKTKEHRCRIEEYQ